MWERWEKCVWSINFDKPERKINIYHTVYIIRELWKNLIHLWEEEHLFNSLRNSAVGNYTRQEVMVFTYYGKLTLSH
jgi:hypothetical protein